MCGRYHFSAELLDEIRDVTEQKDWKLELGVLDRDIHPGDTAPVIVAALEEASHVPAPGKESRGSFLRGPGRESAGLQAEMGISRTGRKRAGF